jgi:hypothetical protein
MTYQLSIQQWSEICKAALEGRQEQRSDWAGWSVNRDREICYGGRPLPHEQFAENIMNSDIPTAANATALAVSGVSHEALEQIRRYCAAWAGQPVPQSVAPQRAATQDRQPQAAAQPAPAAQSRGQPPAAQGAASQAPAPITYSLPPIAPMPLTPLLPSRQPMLVAALLTLAALGVVLTAKFSDALPSDWPEWASTVLVITPVMLGGAVTAGLAVRRERALEARMDQYRADRANWNDRRQRRDNAVDGAVRTALEAARRQGAAEAQRQAPASQGAQPQPSPRPAQPTPQAAPQPSPQAAAPQAAAPQAAAPQATATLPALRPVARSVLGTQRNNELMGWLNMLTESMPASQRAPAAAAPTPRAGVAAPQAAATPRAGAAAPQAQPAAAPARPQVPSALAQQLGMSDEDLRAAGLENADHAELMRTYAQAETQYQQMRGAQRIPRAPAAATPAVPVPQPAAPQQPAAPAAQRPPTHRQRVAAPQQPAAAPQQPPAAQGVTIRPASASPQPQAPVGNLLPAVVEPADGANLDMVALMEQVRGRQFYFTRKFFTLPAHLAQIPQAGGNINEVNGRLLDHIKRHSLTQMVMGRDGRPTPRPITSVSWTGIHGGAACDNILLHIANYLDYIRVQNPQKYARECPELLQAIVGLYESGCVDHKAPILSMLYFGYVAPGTLDWQSVTPASLLVAYFCNQRKERFTRAVMAIVGSDRESTVAMTAALHSHRHTFHLGAVPAAHYGDDRLYSRFRDREWEMRELFRNGYDLHISKDNGQTQHVISTGYTVENVMGEDFAQLINGEHTSGSDDASLKAMIVQEWVPSRFNWETIEAGQTEVPDPKRASCNLTLYKPDALTVILWQMGLITDNPALAVAI